MTLLEEIGVQSKLLNPSGGCHNCPMKLVDFVPATLPTARILVLGEAPGATEVEKGYGWAGRAGEKLRTHFAAVGITEFAYSNVLHCRPPNNATPKPKAVACCLSQFVLDEIRGYPIVVLAGNVPLTALFPGAKSNRFRGNVAHHPDFPGQVFYHIYHPAYMLRRPDLEPRFRQHIERLARIAAGEPPLPWKVLQGGGAEMWAALDKALAAPLISLDVETPTLRSWDPHAQMKSVALTADAKTVIAASEEDSWFVAFLDRIKDYLRKPEKAVVSNNIGFDLDWHEYELDFDVRCTGVYDIGVIWYHAGQYKMPSLKELSANELDGYRYLVYQPHKNTDANLNTLYNGEDVVQALLLFYKGIKLLKPRTRDLCLRVLGPSSLVLRHIQTTGIYLRQEYRAAQIEEHKARRKASIIAWQAADPAFIPTVHESGNGLKEYLFTIHRLESMGTTDKGEPSTDKSTIKKWIRDGAGFLTHLLDVREVDKLLSTYLEAYDKLVEPNNRIHSQYPMTWTDTGRSSSRKPNMQNIARVPAIRDLFGVPPGSVMIEADLSQMEFRIMVCLAKDPTGIQGYINGDDAHTITARNFAPTPTKEQRTRAKPINFALLYGGGWENVQRQARNEYDLDWSQTMCEGFTTIFFDTYQRLPQYHTECQVAFIQNRGWFESILGHIYHYRDWDNPNRGRQEHAFRSYLNSHAQGPCAQIMFAIMVHARRLLNDRNLQRVRFINTVHDSVLIEAPDPKLVPEVVHIMEQARAIVFEWVKPWFVVPLEVEYSVGESWGSLEEYKL
ncbi:hypothetical protein LCGC14_0446750 [marine sediment metagenome]|uniref:DNA-directed DNA polymerase family A palm domain-containing protein n=1 Tax=marine sediment metagenome TaxID=412755 RepID=A0A0F9SPK9_9ZZZZ